MVEQKSETNLKFFFLKELTSSSTFRGNKLLRMTAFEIFRGIKL